MVGNRQIDRLKLIASTGLISQTAKAMCTSYKSAGTAGRCKAWLANLRHKKSDPKVAFSIRKYSKSHYEKIMAQRTGLEPATPGVTGRYSNRLNYRCA